MQVRKEEETEEEAPDKKKREGAQLSSAGMREALSYSCVGP